MKEGEEKDSIVIARAITRAYLLTHVEEEPEYLNIKADLYHALKNLYNHTKNNYQMAGLNLHAKRALDRALKENKEEVEQFLKQRTHS